MFLAEEIFFLEVCNELFDRGMPCMGYPDEEGDTDKGFLTSHNPYPRKISRSCKDLLGKGAGADVPACPECLKLAEPKELKGSAGVILIYCDNVLKFAKVSHWPITYTIQIECLNNRSVSCYYRAGRPICRKVLKIMFWKVPPG